MFLYFMQVISLCLPVLPAFSKILERIVYSRLINFLNNLTSFLIINMVLGKITLLPMP